MAIQQHADLDDRRTGRRVEQRIAVLHCLFAVSTADHVVSSAEKTATLFSMRSAAAG